MGYYRKAYAPRVSAGYNKPQKAAFMYKAEDVWAAAAAAMRVNGQYLKEPTFRTVTDENSYTSMVQEKEANKVLVRQMLAANTTYTEEDIERGAVARKYWQDSLLRMLGGAANDFEQTAIALANKEQIETVYDVSVIASLIASADRALAREAVKEVKLQTNSVHVGKVKDNVVVRDAEVLTVRYNANFGKYRVDVRSNGNLFSWWASKDYTVGARVNIKGKVKAHYADRDTNVAVTQLNYVKEV
jgi:hypothetical protein